MTAVTITVTDTPQGDVSVTLRSPKDVSTTRELDDLIASAVARVRDANGLPSDGTVYRFGESDK